MGEIIALKSCKDCIHVDVCRYRTDPGSKNCVFKHSAADVRPVVREKWIDGAENFTCGNYNAECSNCHANIRWNGCDEDFNFCPNCGADMRGGDEK